jgi:hypothetical protein
VLLNLDGLGGLQAITENLSIRYNDGLSRITDMSNLTQVVQAFNVVSNPNLPCGDIASLGDQLTSTPAQFSWCEGNKDCDKHPACQ